MAAGIVGGACNAIAGGGTFFTFPALLAVGVPPVTANATCAISIWPGHAASLLGYRKELRRQAGRLTSSAPAFVLGATVGAGLLAVTGNGLFRQLIPWLLLTATLLFAAGPRLRAWMIARRSGEVPRWAAFACDFAVAVYGGYFGAALGILLMAVLTLVGLDDVNEANAVKNAFATIVSSLAVATFVVVGMIAWGPGAAVLAGAIAGGYLGARLARWVSPSVLRGAVIAVGLALTVMYL
ncbi:sulfite exporter TauE/SafE family protein [Acuticoccus sediminis]|uniref:sulfite exporter TauE/SafE family protein n=1 Tax=Acuticoccus sediminis TaxID=2184697 RepID=UPI001FD14EEB|nr:sulfite exporter TauE/SafE family protein [Acuticoccus sediminis]